MPIQVSYPGVYVQEVAGGQPSVPGISTSSTAFADFFARGPMHKAVELASMEDFNRTFGGLNLRSEASYALQQYYLNGGQQAWVIRTGDGGAKKSHLDVKVKTPGLAARFQWASEYTGLAEKAREAAHAAAEAAGESLQFLQGEVTEQEREQGLKRLQSSGRQAAVQTEEAAAQTRAAAREAAASCDELAIAIAAFAAASGPSAGRTASAAAKSAAAAKASARASQANVDVIGAAQLAASVAEDALKAAQAARTTTSAAEYLQEVLEALNAINKAAVTADMKNDIAKGATEETQVLAEQSAAQATEATEEGAEQAEIAVESLLIAAKTVSDYLEANKEMADRATAFANHVKAVEELQPKVEEVAKEAAEASWDAQTGIGLASAQQAAARATATAKKMLEEIVTPSQQAAAAALKEVLAMSVEAAEKAVKVVGAAESPAAPAAAAAPAPAPAAEGEAAEGEAAEGEAAEGAAPAAPAPAAAEGGGGESGVAAVIKAAIMAINNASDAAKSSATAAKKAAADAKVAASAVGSAAVGLASRQAEAAAHKIVKVTGDTLQAAKTVALQVNQANMAARQSVKPATLAAEAAKAAKSDSLDEGSIKSAFAAAQAALNAGNNALAAAEMVEKAAVETSKITVEASYSADVAAQAAKVAVAANEEASRPPTLKIEAGNEGVWGDNLRIEIQIQGAEFNLSVGEFVTDRGITRQVSSENYSQLNLEDGDKHNAVELVNSLSTLITLDYIGPKVPGAYPSEVGGDFLGDGHDGGLADAVQLTGAGGALSALDTIAPSIFNLLCLPAVASLPDAQASVAIANAQKYCKDKRAFFIADIPAAVDSVDKMLGWIGDYGNADAFNSAVYFPRLVIPDPLQDYRPRNVGASGSMAGIYARTDTSRGIWKAPAGINAVLRGAQIAVKLDDNMNGKLNVRGVNVLRSFPIYGNISWGARTLAGADALNSEWKYINVRRLMYFVEESLYQSLKWAVFEPNDEVLWGKIRVQVASFLAGLFADGAFSGATPAESFFVGCDGTTTSPLDIDMGLVNVKVGIAPSKPAEFVVLEMQQMAGQNA